ncbi:MAG: glycosyltransferase [Hyphomicrobiales bacterium]
MTLAIVTTYYNEVETIDDVVTAIAKAPSPFALYLIDDCSSKPPENVLTRYGDEEWFHYFRNDENKGTVFGLNRGIKAALADGAKFIAINDSDDISYDNRFPKQLEALNNDPDLMIIGGGADFTDQETDQLLWNTQHPSDNANIHRRNKINSVFVHSTVIYRAEVFEKVGFYREGVYALDYEMITRLLATGCKAANLPETVLKYNVRENSMSVSKRRTQIASRLKVQLAHINIFNPWSLWGIVRSMMAYLTPDRMLSNLKTALHKRNKS